MGLLNKLLGRKDSRDALWLHVRCNKCGARVRVRVDLYNDLSQADDEGYILHKEIMDDKCFQLIYAELRFDDQRQIASQDISGGEFITADEYESPSEQPLP